MEAKRISEAEALFECVYRVREHFIGYPGKAVVWFETPNLILGGASPLQLIRAGHAKKLRDVIDNLLSGNIA